MSQVVKDGDGNVIRVVAAPFNASVFILETSEQVWLPAEICIGHTEFIECESCGTTTNTWMLTYVQGGPPDIDTDPDNIWVYQCLPCGVKDCEGNIVNSDRAEEMEIL